MTKRPVASPGPTTIRVAGALFLTAMFGSLAGAILLESMLTANEPAASLAASPSLVWTGVMLELLNGVSVIGIALMMAANLRRYSETIALGYISVRLVEALFCLTAAIVPVALMALGQHPVNDGAAVVQVLLGTRAFLSTPLIAVFFCVGALMLYAMLLRHKLTPRWLSIWGLIATVMVLALNVIPALASVGMVLALPIILQEITMGIWFIAKGMPAQHV